MNRVLRVLDVCSGTGSSTIGFEDRGHEVRRLDVDAGLGGVHYQVDVRRFARDPDAFLLGWRPDVVWASPPCKPFSLAGHVDGRWVENDDLEDSVYGGWYLPGDREARLGVARVLACLRIVEVLEPEFWWLENPVCRLRGFPFMKRAAYDRATVTYCAYWNARLDPGLKPRMKATDLWGCFPESWEPRPRCASGEVCHAPSPRGVTAGTQALHPRERAMVPYELSNEIARAVERDMGIGWG